MPFICLNEFWEGHPGRIMQKEAEELVWTEYFKSGGQAVSRWMFVCLHECVCVSVYVRLVLSHLPGRTSGFVCWTHISIL